MTVKIPDFSESIADEGGKANHNWYNFWKNLISTADAALLGPPAFGGRLTAVSGQAVQLSDVLGATIIYYTPYIHDRVAVNNGTRFSNLQFAETSVALDATNWVAGNNYDFFVFNDAGTVRLGYGPAWASSTARSTATFITQTGGPWVNTSNIVLRRTSAVTATIAAGQATYVGSGRASGNSQCSVEFHPAAGIGGTSPYLGIFNAYNRVRTVVKCQDSTSIWSYQSSAVRPVNASTTNRINFIDGLGVVQWNAWYGTSCAPRSPPAPTAATVGIALDNSVNFSGGAGAGAHFEQMGSNNNFVGAGVEGFYAPFPTIGFHFVQAMEQTDVGCAMDFFGNDFMMITLDTEY